MLSNVRVTMKSVHYGSPCLSHVTNTKIHSVCRKDIPLPLVQHTLVSHTHTHTRTQITAGFCQTSAPNTCRVSPNKCKLGTKYLKSLSFMGTKYLQFCQTWAPNTWRVCHSWAPNTCRVLSNLGTKYLQSLSFMGTKHLQSFVTILSNLGTKYLQFCQTWAPNTCRVMLNLGTKYLQSFVKPAVGWVERCPSPMKHLCCHQWSRDGFIAIGNRFVQTQHKDAALNFLHGCLVLLVWNNTPQNTGLISKTLYWTNFKDSTLY